MNADQYAYLRTSPEEYVLEWAESGGEWNRWDRWMIWGYGGLRRPGLKVSGGKIDHCERKVQMFATDKKMSTDNTYLVLSVFICVHL